MKVTVFGAGGKTGKLVTERAMAAGHSVTAFMHEGGRVEQQNLRVVMGDVTDEAAVKDAVADSDAVIDAIGGETPYKTTDLETRAAHNIIRAMQSAGAKRLVVISMMGVGDSAVHAPFWYEYLMKPTFLRGASKDKDAMEHEVSHSGLDFVIARPPILTDDPAKGQVQVITGETKAHQITRADLAQFLVDQLEDDSHLGQAVTIANS